MSIGQDYPIPIYLNKWGFNRSTHNKRVKHPLLQAAQDLRDPSFSVLSKTWENSTEKSRKQLTNNQNIFF